MKVGTLVAPNQTLPQHVFTAIHRRFPDRTLADLIIRYYACVEDVGYEFYVEKVLPTCCPSAAVHYLAPFISYVRLGEALILDREDGLVVYESDGNDCCTETGPFWFITPNAPKEPC
jgi:hypothetical protein